MKVFAERHMVLLQLLFLCVFLSLWQYAASAGRINPFVASSPNAILQEVWSWIADRSIFVHIAATLEIIFLGYGIGVAGGLAIGVLKGLSPTAKAYLDPFLVFGNSLPRIILIPFFVVWLGFGLAPKVITVFLVLVFMVTAIIENGMKEIGRDIIANARVLGAGPFGLLWDVYLPGLGLWVLVSARVCVGYALQAAVVSEFFGAHEGLGFLIMKGEGSYDVATIYGALLVTVVLALIFHFILGLIERRVTRWLPAR
jgi:NitT/TauT family transport system permease protein